MERSWLMQTPDLLVLAAHELELRALRAALPGLGESGPRIATAVVGVGMAAAGAGTALALARTPARRALLVGSCGSYPGSGLAQLSLLAPRLTRAVDPATLEGRSALPEALAQRATLDAALHAELCRRVPEAVADGVVATTLGITTDDALAALIARETACSAENLELLAIALACSAAAVPLGALLCCTNAVGAEGRRQWLANHERAAEKTAEACLRVIAALPA